MLVKCPIIDSPTLDRYSTGLFASLPYEPMASTEEAVGTQWTTETCGSLVPHTPDGCYSPNMAEQMESVEKNQGDGLYGTSGTCMNLTFTSGKKCKTVGDLADESISDAAMVEAARQKMIHGLEFSWEMAISTGYAWSPPLDEEKCPIAGPYERAFQLYRKGDPDDNDMSVAATPFCVDVEKALDVCPDGAYSPRLLIAALENVARECSPHEQPTIYLPSGAAALMVGACGPVFEVGENRFRTAMKTRVVFGWGFRGVDPMGNDPDDDEAYAYMGSAWRTRRSTIYDDMVQNPSEYIEKVKNDRTVLLELDVGGGPRSACKWAYSRMRMC